MCKELFYALHIKHNITISFLIFSFYSLLQGKKEKHFRIIKKARVFFSLHTNHNPLQVINGSFLLLCFQFVRYSTNLAFIDFETRVFDLDWIGVSSLVGKRGEEEICSCIWMPWRIELEALVMLMLVFFSFHYLLVGLKEKREKKFYMLLFLLKYIQFHLFNFSFLQIMFW